MNEALDLGTSFAEGKDEDSLPAVSPTRYERLELIGSGAFGEVYRGYVPKLSVVHTAQVNPSMSSAKSCSLSLASENYLTATDGTGRKVLKWLSRSSTWRLCMFYFPFHSHLLCRLESNRCMHQPPHQSCKQSIA